MTGLGLTWSSPPLGLNQRHRGSNTTTTTEIDVTATTSRTPVEAHPAISTVQHRLPSTSCCRHGHLSWVLEPRVEHGPGPYTTWLWWQNHPFWAQPCLDSEMGPSSPGWHIFRRQDGRRASRPKTSWAAESRLARGGGGDHRMAGGWPGNRPFSPRLRFRSLSVRHTVRVFRSVILPR